MNLILPALICGHLLLLAFISVTKPGKANVGANRWLSFLFLSVAWAFAGPVVKDETIVRLMELSRFAMAPALYLSVSYFTTPGKQFKVINLLHFIPFLLFAVFAQTFIIPLSFKITLEQLVWQVTRINPGFLVVASLAIQIITYWILSWIRLMQHEKNVKLFVSVSQSISLWWLRYLLVGLVLMVFLWVAGNIFQISIINTFAPYGNLLAVYFIAYFSLRQGEIFAFDKQSIAEIKEIIQEQNTKPSSKPSRISHAEFDALKQKLESLMAIEKLFLNPTLGLPDLAARVNITPHQLSYLINEGFNENFYQFVNRFRVEEAKRLLRSEMHRHLNMVGIAYESGFNSKTTFNTTFKKLAGFSPSDYQLQAAGEGLEPASSPAVA